MVSVGDEHRLDARGLLCPMPVIRTQERVATLQREVMAGTVKLY